jgi:hypothetical protein
MCPEQKIVMSFFRSNAAPKINRKCLFDVIYINSHCAMQKAYATVQHQVRTVGRLAVIKITTCLASIGMLTFSKTLVASNLSRASLASC